MRPREFDRAIVGFEPNLRAFAYSICWNWEEAKELTQETILRALESYEDYVPGSMRSWLCKILQNRHRDVWSHYQFEGRRLQLLRNTALTMHIVAPTQISNVATKMVAEYLSVMGEDRREALVLQALGYEYQEIAERQGVAIGTIRSRIDRARQELADAMTVYAIDDLFPGVCPEQAIAARAHARARCTDHLMIAGFRFVLFRREVVDGTAIAQYRLLEH